MKSSIHLVITLAVSFLLSTHNAQASPRPKNRISNSYSDTTNIFKHEVLLNRASSSCTGSIVSNWHVLTAAHCVIQDGSAEAAPEIIEVTVGITKIDNDYEFQTIRLVETIYTPSHYVNVPVNASDDVFINNIGDIALLKLNYGLGIGLDPRIEALKIPYYEYKSHGSTGDNQLYFTGFGRITDMNVYDPDEDVWVPAATPTHLHYTLARELPPSSCPSLGNRKLKMCAKLDNAGGMCSGDSGGPLFVEDENGRVVFGVASYGEGVCSEDEAYYTRVFPYADFISNAANDRVDKSIRRQSYEYHEDYQKYLKQNRYRYHWIFVPDVVKQAYYPKNNAP